MLVGGIWVWYVGVTACFRCMPRVVAADTAIPLMLNPLILYDLACISALCIRDGAGGATLETLGRDGSIRATDKAGVSICGVGLWSVVCSRCGITMTEWGDGYGWGNFLSRHACRACVSVVCVCVCVWL